MLAKLCIKAPFIVRDDVIADDDFASDTHLFFVVVGMQLFYKQAKKTNQCCSIL
jgi:hypothetical protein